MTRASAKLNPRIVFIVAATVAAVVTTIFATVGDGVDPGGDGLRGLVMTYGHTATWALLTIAFAVAAVRGAWSRVSQVTAMTGLVMYVVFLAVVVAF